MRARAWTSLGLGQAKDRKWIARIRYGGKMHYLGHFHTKEEAAHAYDKAVREHAPGRPTNYTAQEAAEKAKTEQHVPSKRFAQT